MGGGEVTYICDTDWVIALMRTAIKPAGVAIYYPLSKNIFLYLLQFEWVHFSAERHFQTLATYNDPTERDEEATRVSKRIGYLDISGILYGFLGLHMGAIKPDTNRVGSHQNSGKRFLRRIEV